MATANWYGSGLVNLMSGNYSWNDNFGIKCSLLSPSYTPSEEHTLYEHVSSFEISTVAPILLTGNTVTYLAVPNEIWLNTAVDISYADANFVARYAAIYTYDADDAEKCYLIGYVDFGETKTVDDADFSMIWNTNGIFRTRKA